MVKTKKKKNYRLRKSVRRTLGALFMISAIIVAAIPFPDAAATNGEEPPEGSDNNIVIDYGVTEDDFTTKVELLPSDDDDVKAAFALVKVGNKYEYKWQYKYFIKNTGSAELPELGAIISQFNQGYTVDKVSLTSVNADTYIEVSAEDDGAFYKFFSEPLTGDDIDKHTYTYTYADWSNAARAEALEDFSVYFPTAYSEYATACQKRTDAENKGESVNQEIIAATDVTVKGNDIPNTKPEIQKIYYLENCFKQKFSRDKFELIDILIPAREANADSDNYEVHYYVKLKDPDDSINASYTCDDNGFLFNAKKSYPIVGIGQYKTVENDKTVVKGAFENYQQSISLELPEGIIYIADRAFKDSNITGIKINNVSTIGNEAFKGSDIKTLTWGIAPSKIIGAEAFSDTKLQNISIPDAVEEIGAGAFSYNDSLTSINIDDSSKVKIGKYAFYDCTELGNIDFTNKKISSIGEGAFAVLGLTQKCTSFKFPDTIRSVDSLEPKILAGRTDLETVVMPSELGYSKKETLPDDIFSGCTGLKCVEFSDNSTLIRFKPDTFKSVENQEFYVKGPKFTSNGVTIAGPRQSTWACTIKNGSAVPYMYLEDNKEYYEICRNKKMILSIDESGILQKCDYVEENENKDYEITYEPKNVPNLIIPGIVGEIAVKGIAQGCFTKELLKNIDGPLVIKDGGKLTTIDDNVFADASFSYVYLGDSVEKIGANAFANCKSLTQVTIGKNIKEIGDSAFNGCVLLTQVHFVEPDNLSTLSKIGTNAFNTDSSGDDLINKLVMIGTISSKYLPFTWAMDENNYADKTEGVRVCYKSPAPTANLVLESNYNTLITEENDGATTYTRTIDGIEGIPTNLSVILDNATLLPTLVDYQHYSDIDESIRTAYENGDETGYNDFEKQQILTAYNILVPDGVKSIDVKKFFESPEGKVNNSKSILVYLNQELDSERVEQYKKYGLFAGEFDDYADGSQKETETKGNDRITSVELRSVEYLPDNAFDDCENLATVILSPALKELGSIPFSNCPALSNIGFESEEKYYCKNGIIYENKSDGTKAIVECLAGRGVKTGNTNINLSNDPDLSSTSEIKPKAFSGCPNITSFDLTGVPNINAIPERCFEDCPSLIRADLPETVEEIDFRAFATLGNYIELTIRGRDLALGSQICGNENELRSTTNPGGTQAFVYTYDKSGVGRTLAKQGITIQEPPLAESKVYEVKFFDYDFKTQIGTTQEVEHGKFASEPAKPSRNGYTFKGWSNTEWLNDGKNTTGVTRNLDVYAMYEPNTSTNNNNNSNNNNSNNSNNSNNNNSNNKGENKDAIKGDYVNGGIDTNNDGIPDVDEKGNKLYKLTVTNGEGSGYYKAGKTVNIKAGIAPKGTSFAYWSCSNNNLIFQDHTDWITTLTMVAEDVTVICNFDGQYRLEVEYGTGSGSYPAGAKVAISALEAPEGREFASWTTKTNGLNIEDSTKATTIITMPQGNALITATYKDTPKKGTVSSNTTSPSKNNTSVVITKPGISDKNSASAYVSGSSDNFVVKISESLDAADEVQRALQKKYPDMSRIKYFAMDISLYDAKGENKITNTDGLKVNVTMPIPDALREYAGNNRVGAVKNGELETLNPKFTTINGVPSVTFTATHFSPYTIYVDTGNMTAAGTLDSTPKTGDGIHPKWFLSLGLACISIILFTKRDKKYVVKA